MKKVTEYLKKEENHAKLLRAELLFAPLLIICPVFASVYFVDIPAIQQFGTIVIIMTVSSLVAAVFILPIFYSLKFVK